MTLLTVTLNPCVDKTYTVPGFVIGAVHRPTEWVFTAGGKGINVARGLRTLGGDSLATGFVGGSTGQWIREELDREQLAADFLSVDQESRSCMAIVDPVSQSVTELNEIGPPLTIHDENVFSAHLRNLLPQCSAIIFSGSLPPGASDDLYARLIRLAQDECGVKAVLDTSGPPLVEGAKARPYLIKPNVAEAQAAFDLDPERWDVGADALRKKLGLTHLVLTNGRRGAVLSTDDGLWKVAAPSVNMVSAVGSGDSFAAGFLWALENGYNSSEMIRLGVAAGAANAETSSAAVFSSDRVFELFYSMSSNTISS